MYAKGVAGETGGERVSKQRAKRAKPSLAGLPLGSLCSPIFAVSPYFFPFAPSMEPGPRLCPWRALSDNQPSMFEHLLLHRKKQTALQVGVLKSQSRTLSFQYKLFLIILYQIHYTVFILNTNYQ